MLSIYFPCRMVDPIYRKHFRERIPWYSLAPEKIGRSSKKISVPYGDVDDPLDMVIESVPPFDRIDALIAFGEITKREEAHELARFPLFNDPKIDYMRNLVGKMYLEIDLMKEFLRFAYGINYTGYSGPRSAIWFIQNLREYARKTVGHLLEFISARMLMDWLVEFKRNRCFRIEIGRPHSLLFTPINNLPGNSLINLQIGVWKQILENRLNRLLLTGYENIDM